MSRPVVVLAALAAGACVTTAPATGPNTPASAPSVSREEAPSPPGEVEPVPTVSSPRRRPSVERIPAACPMPMLELGDRCAAATPEGYGTTPEQPLEWGAAAMGELWRGRLVCPGGGWPEVRRKGSMAAPVESSSPKSPYAKLKVDQAAPDLIDAWVVECPGRAPETWFANIYRCGSPCPPTPFTLAPVQGELAFQRAVASVRARDPDGALDAIDAALAIMPTNEKYHSYRGIVLMRLDRAAEALAEFDAALAIDPESAYHRRNRIDALEVEGRFEEATHEWRRLVAGVESDDEDRPKILCDHASWLLERGHDEEAIATARTACEAGDERCCR